MMSKLKLYASIAGVVIVDIFAGWVAGLVSDNNQLTVANKSLTTHLVTANLTIATINAQQIIVADIDKKYTQELTNAKSKIDDLQRAVDGGTKRLQLNATCPELPKTTTTASMVNATSARLTDTARRDYFILRKRIEQANKQILGLQDYINEICL